MGYAYILSNPSMPGLVKVGCTDRSPEERIAELSTATGIPTPFCLEFSVFVRDHIEAERETHKALNEFRVSGDREFFRVSVEQAKATLLVQWRSQLIKDLDALDDTVVEQLLETILLGRPLVLDLLFKSERVHNVVKPVVHDYLFASAKPEDMAKSLALTFSDEQLMEFLKSIFRERPTVRRVYTGW